MPRIRSRSKTEEKFQNAVLELVARDGCSDLGINAVAQEAGADKVLIYRYFGDFIGLLQVVAGSKQWLPTGEDILNQLPHGETDALAALSSIQNTLLHHVRSDACTQQLVRWRRAGFCPICRQFTQEWQNLWKALPALLAQDLNSEQRRLWHQACQLSALMVEAELCSEPVDRHCLSLIAERLEAIHIQDIEEGSGRILEVEDSLPTNLL